MKTICAVASNSGAARTRTTSNFATTEAAIITRHDNPNKKKSTRKTNDNTFFTNAQRRISPIEVGISIFSNFYSYTMTSAFVYIVCKYPPPQSSVIVYTITI